MTVLIDRCVDAYGNERPTGHIRRPGHTHCARCGKPLPANRTSQK
ncbi:hypothetical protein TPA0906_66700 [Streptomyces olivaceus]|nr:hypothetical protein [Streptomyces olivaceus]GHJ04805.1 hypothetical protein TPA0906_66700 [Streptomyces olivaceus]